MSCCLLKKRAALWHHIPDLCKAQQEPWNQIASLTLLLVHTHLSVDLIAGYQRCTHMFKGFGTNSACHQSVSGPHVVWTLPVILNMCRLLSLWYRTLLAHTPHHTTPCADQMQLDDTYSLSFQGPAYLPAPLQTSLCLVLIASNFAPSSTFR